MQPMSDKELDKLFQGEFESFEVEPSAGLWGKIDAELASAAPVKGKKKTFPLFWMAAASVVAVMTAGIYFMQPVAKVQLRGKADSQMANNNKIETSSSEGALTQATIVKDVPNQSKQSGQRQLIASLGAIRKTVNNHISEESSRKIAVNNDNVEVTYDNTTANTMAGNNAPVINADIQAMPSVATLAASPAKINPRTITSLPTNTALDEVGQEQLPKRKIRSIGDLVNRVIATVDPREDKLIQFSNNDEGTEVSGINLGLIKFKHNHNNK